MPDLRFLPSVASNLNGGHYKNRYANYESVGHKSSRTLDPYPIALIRQNGKLNSQSETYTYGEIFS